ncbi:N-acetylmuramoyl-L-alanine amidase family protein [Flaviaesturariibacter aridisoli]|uniref:N-acetylmuramoyl-L-alanine amidase n=1 Tax=Flaviaesturariibacter aridisoli TaxID=2545761 RepID=A0A4R4DZQ3_9BACT|nr:N-acetylmuramoyl-L-alanine amidase [Flaviaesturariibacter aridisoli]TCZ68085.1 N-acetylmuramoyl-L-alanine amidase [Flaviaesturariibacter aridisoli]
MLKKTFTVLCCALFGLALMALRKPQPVKTVVIDAGHGVMPSGGYNGARGSYSYEDDICYAIAKKLVAQIHKDHPEVRVVETRPTRNITNLHERADIANREKGDLFISIHVNAMDPIRKRELVGYETETYYTGKGKKKKKHTRKVPQYRTYSIPSAAKGTQTYIWGAHKSGQKELAVRENAQIQTETNQAAYGDVDVNSPEFMAIAAVQTKQYWMRSSRMADFVESEFARVGRVSQGSYQRQVGIWVLQATNMPSVLVETGFITNKQEEDYLNSESGQQEVAECLSRAMGNYMSWVDKNGKGSKSTTALPATDAASTAAFLENIEKQEQAARHGR